MQRYLADRAPLTYVRDRYEDAGARDEVWAGLADLGVTSLLVPEAVGGAGMGMVEAAVVLEEIGRAVYPGPYEASAIGAASIVTTAGDADDQAALLPDLASGAAVGTLAHLEPGRRAAWRAPVTRAVRDEDGWRVSGEKAHVRDGAVADHLFVTATDADEHLAVFAIDATDAGVAVTATPTVDGSRKEATVTLDGAPARRLAATDATEAVAEAVDRLVIAAVVDGVGAASRALELSLEYAKERRQFGVPVGSFQAVQHLCADMLRAVELARAAGYYACWAADAAPAEERHRAATLALAHSADALYQVGASAVQVHAGVGFTWEHDIHLFYKRLLTLQHTAGGSLDQLDELAAIVLDEP